MATSKIEKPIMCWRDLTITTSAYGNVDISSSVPTGFRPIAGYSRNSGTAGYVVLPYRNSGSWLLHVQKNGGEAVASDTFGVTIAFMSNTI